LSRAGPYKNHLVTIRYADMHAQKRRYIRLEGKIYTRVKDRLDMWACQANSSCWTARHVTFKPYSRRKLLGYRSAGRSAALQFMYSRRRIRPWNGMASLHSVFILTPHIFWFPKAFSLHSATEVVHFGFAFAHARLRIKSFI